MIRHSDPPARQQLHRLHCKEGGAEGLRFEARRAGGGLVFGAEGAELGDAVRVRSIVPTAEE
jgi:hypothetical protein